MRQYDYNKSANPNLCDKNSTFRRWDKILYNSSIAIAHHILVLCTFCFDVNSPMPLDYMETKSLGI